MKIRIRTHVRLHMDSLCFFIALLCISSYALLEHVSISIPAFSPVKYILLYMAGICLIFKISLIIRNLRKKKYFYVALLLLIIIGALSLSAYMNRRPVVGSSPVYGTIRLILYLLELFALVIWCVETAQFRDVVRFLYRYLLILVVITDVILFAGWMQFSSGDHVTYLIGTKFSVAYRHIELLALWLMCDRERFLQLRRKKRWMILITILLVILSYVIDCMTGIVGVVLFFSIYSFVDNRKSNRIQWISNPMVFAVSLLCSVFFALIIDVVVMNPIVKFLVEDIFQRDTTLTGRIFIFEMFGEKMSGHWLYGFGFGNGNSAAKWLFQYANAQNALLHWVLQAGLLVTLALCCWMFRIFTQLYKSKSYCQITPIVVLIYVFVLLGVIETTFNMALILWCALILMYTGENNTCKSSPQ